MLLIRNGTHNPNRALNGHQRLASYVPSWWYLHKRDQPVFAPELCHVARSARRPPKGTTLFLLTAGAAADLPQHCDRPPTHR